MINLINGKTLYELQMEHGVKQGLIYFASRCVGATTGSALEIIGQLMQAKQEVVDLKFADPEVKQYIAHRLDQMGLVGFIWDGDKLSYYPFKEHQHVQEIKVPVSPYDGEVVAPRSYSVVEHPEGAEVQQPSVEQSDEPVRQAPDES